MVSEHAAKLLDELLRLSEDERSEIASKLVASMDGPPDDERDRDWAIEIEARAQRALAGESPGSAWESVRARIQAKLSGA